MQELTKAESEIMQHLWQLENAFIKDILAVMPAPKPAYNTVSTIIRILTQKGFVGYQELGKTHRYHPLVSKAAYSEFIIKKQLHHFFGGSWQTMLSFFIKNKDLSLQELDELMRSLQQDDEPQDTTLT